MNFFLLSSILHLSYALSAIGIDLGSSAIKVAAIQYGASSFELVYDKGSERVFKPTFAYYNNEYYFSHEAEKLLVRCPDCVLPSFTRKLFESSPLETEEIKLGDKKFSIVEISALFFTYLKETVCLQLSENVSSCAIAVTEDSSDKIKFALREGALEAGWENVSIFSGLFASSLYYALQNRSTEKNSTISLINFGHRLTSAVTFEMIPKKDDQPLSISYIAAKWLSSGINGIKYEEEILKAVVDSIPSDLKSKVLNNKKAMAALHRKIPGLKKTLGFKNIVGLTSDVYDQEDQEFNVTVDGSKINEDLEGAAKESSKFIHEYISEFKADTYVAIGAHQRSVPIQNITKSLNISFINSINPEDCIAFGSAFLAARDHPSFRTYSVKAHDFTCTPVCIDIEDKSGKISSHCLPNSFDGDKLAVEFQVSGRHFKISHIEESNAIWHVSIDAPFECKNYKLLLYLGSTGTALPLSLECMDLEKGQDIPLKGKEVLDIQKELQIKLQNVKDSIKEYQEIEKQKSLRSAIKNNIEGFEAEISSETIPIRYKEQVELHKSKLETMNGNTNELESLLKDILLIKSELQECNQRYETVKQSQIDVSDPAILAEIRDLINGTTCLDIETKDKCIGLIRKDIEKNITKSDDSAPNAKQQTEEATHLEL